MSIGPNSPNIHRVSLVNDTSLPPTVFQALKEGTLKSLTGLNDADLLRRALFAFGPNPSDENGPRIYPPFSERCKGVVIVPNPYRIAAFIEASNSYNKVTDNVLERKGGHIDVDVILAQHQVLDLQIHLRKLGFAIALPSDMDPSLLDRGLAEGQIFNRDTVVVWPKLGSICDASASPDWIALITRMNRPGRQLETPYVQELVEKLCHYGFIQETRIINGGTSSAEGGDLIPWFDPSTGEMCVHVGISQRTNRRGADALFKQYAGPEYKQNPKLRINYFDLRDDILHLDCVMGSPAPGVLLINPEGLKNYPGAAQEDNFIMSLFERYPEIQFIFTVPESERYTGSLATNFERLGKTAIIYPAGYPNTLSLLREIMSIIDPGVAIIETNLSALRELDGAARCATEFTADELANYLDLTQAQKRILRGMKERGVYLNPKMLN